MGFIYVLIGELYETDYYDITTVDQAKIPSQMNAKRFCSRDNSPRVGEETMQGKARESSSGSAHADSTGGVAGDITSPATPKTTWIARKKNLDAIDAKSVQIWPGTADGPRFAKWDRLSPYISR